MPIKITKCFAFEMAHALPQYDGKCKNLHGHSYKLKVTVKGAVDPNSQMVIDFKALKDLVNQHVIDRFDHAIVLHKKDISDELARALSAQFARIVWFDVPPTTENLLLHFVALLRPVLPCGVTLCTVFLQETEDSYAEWEE